MRSWDILPVLVESNGGALRWPVRELREFTGKKQTGVRVAETIERELAALNIGHLPPRIPRDQNAQVLLYNQDRANIGLALHLARLLASGEQPDGMGVEDQVRMLETALKMHTKPFEAFAPATLAQFQAMSDESAAAAEAAGATE